MARSRMYAVKGDRIELLFWKKAPALLVNLQSSTYSTDVPFISAVEVFVSAWGGDSVRVLGFLYKMWGGASEVEGRELGSAQTFFLSFRIRSGGSLNTVDAPLFMV